MSTQGSTWESRVASCSCPPTGLELGKAWLHWLPITQRTIGLIFQESPGLLLSSAHSGIAQWCQSVMKSVEKVSKRMESGNCIILFQKICLIYGLELSYVALFDIVKHGYYRENVSCLFLNDFPCKICHSSYIWSENELILFQISSHTLPKQTVQVKGWQFVPVYCCMGLY